MAAGYNNLYLEQGTDFNTQLTLDDQYGTPYNLTNFTIHATARKSYFTNNTAINFVATIVNANNGVIQLSANSAVTSNVSAIYNLVYDVIIKDTTSNNITRVLEGQIFVSPAVTSIF
jgi:hypothetical protein